MSLYEYFEKIVTVITNDGRNIIGKLRGSDQAVNIILENSHERIFSEDEPVIINPLGLYIIRGDTIAIIAEYDEELDSQRDLESIRARPLLPISHS